MLRIFYIICILITHLAHSACPLDDEAHRRTLLQELWRYVQYDSGHMSRPEWDTSAERLFAPTELLGPTSKVGQFPFITLRRRSFPASDKSDLIWVPLKGKCVPKTIPENLDFSLEGDTVVWVSPTRALALKTGAIRSRGQLSATQDEWVVIDASGRHPRLETVATPWGESWGAPALTVDTNSRQVQDPMLIRTDRREIRMRPHLFYSVRRNRVFAVLGELTRNQVRWRLYSIDPAQPSAAARIYDLEIPPFITTREGAVTRWLEPLEVTFSEKQNELRIRWRDAQARDQERAFSL